MRSLLSAFSCVTGLLVATAFTSSVSAAPSLFIDEGAFNTNAAGLTLTTVDFDAAMAGDIIGDGTSFGGLTFAYVTGLGVDELIVADGAGGFDPVVPSSGTNYLGTSNNGDELFIDGTEFSMSVPTGFNAFSFKVLTSDQLFLEDDIQISAGGMTYNITNATFDNEVTVADGFDDDYEYFFSLVDVTTPFTNITITAPDFMVGTGFFGIDDIQFAAAPATAVPEPGSLIFLTASALSAFGVTRRRRRIESKQRPVSDTQV